ncbi:MAG: glutamate--cysteine ligase [Gammaproteobacteria bacterium]|nr:MAG: glutamate--cysteine ligase [Gammaproteobacteria bacterium]
MGQEVARERFTPEDFRHFAERLAVETDYLERLLEEGRLDKSHPTTGFEIEAWLVDERYRPYPVNEAFLRLMGTPRVVPELARFNFELNSTAYPLEGTVLRSLHEELDDNWKLCREKARTLGGDAVMIGILPTVREEDLTLKNMSPLHRYHALNEQILRLRHGRPLRLHIKGREELITTPHKDVMLESAATAFQTHIRVNPDLAVRFYNASLILSAVTVAVSANSPYLFGRDLWDETRIPLFEQAILVKGYEDRPHCRVTRVTFGSGYARRSLIEVFRENQECYPVILPMPFHSEAEAFNYLRLHNGTIWRWNRPLIGFDEAGKPHLRIEHRVTAAGPTSADVIANMALYLGLVHALATQDAPPEHQLEFRSARANFYRAAREGLPAPITWLEGKRWTVGELLLERLLPLAREGLEDLGVDKEDVAYYMDIIEARVKTGQNGASWQRAYVAEHGPDMEALAAAYAERSHKGQPVHRWSL